MTPIGVYAGLVIATLLLSTLRQRPVRVDVRALLFVHAVLALWEAALLLLTSTGSLPVSTAPGTGSSTLDYAAVTLLTIGAAASARLRRWWYLSPCDVATARAIVEESLSRLRFEAQPAQDGWTIRSGDVEAALTIRPLPGPGVALHLHSGGASPKVDLLRALLVKRFEPLVPRARIRLR